MWIPYNPNPMKRTDASDCVIRAVCMATNRCWYDVYDDIYLFGRQTCNMPPDDRVWGEYLYRIGFQPFLLPDACPECTTVEAFCDYFPYGTYIIGTGTHAVCVMDGNYYDSWDSGRTVPSFFFERRI